MTLPLGLVAGVILAVSAAWSVGQFTTGHAQAAGALLVALTVAHWLPNRWVAFGDATHTQSTGTMWIGAAAAVLPLPLLVVVCSVGHVAGWALTCRVGNGVHRPPYDVDACTVNASIGTLAGLAAGGAAALVDASALAAAIAAVTGWVASSLVVALLEGFVAAQPVGRLWAGIQRQEFPAQAAMAVGAAVLAVAVERLGPWGPTVVGIGVVVLVSRQAAALHQFRTVTATLLELATSATSAISVEDVVELVEHTGRGILGRDVRLLDSRENSTAVAAAVATEPVGSDGWLLAVGEGTMGRPFGSGPREERALSGLAEAAAVALTAARARQQIRAQATHDELTGLLNRRGFDDEASRVLGRAAHDGRRVTVAYVDLNGFKQVNDTFGHDAGDEVLVAVGDALRTHLRPVDVAGRLGGDEFAVLFGEELGEDTARDRMVAALADLPHGVGASLGAVSGDGDLTTLVKQADQRMYAAKKARR